MPILLSMVIFGSGLSLTGCFDKIDVNNQAHGNSKIDVLTAKCNDTENYFCINTIEGSNQEFIQHYGYSSQYYSYSIINQIRTLESDYLGDGVYDNKIDAVVDLIIVDKEIKKPLRQKSVASKLLVEINNIVTFEEAKSDKTEKATYKYNKDGSREEISREEISTKTK